MFRAINKGSRLISRTFIVFLFFLSSISMNEEFEIFIPKPKNRITPNKITFALYAICVITFMISAINHYNPQIVLSVFIIPLSVSLYFFIKKFWTYKSLDGELTGSMILASDYVKIASQSFAINEIKKVRFSFR